MRRAFLALATVFYIVPTTAQVQDEFTRACDLAAANPYDSARPADIPGVIVQKIDPKAALTACETALAVDPENPRLLFELGRAWQANKNDSQARVFYEKAAAHNYASAQVDLAHFHVAGRGGLPKNDEEAARLYKLAADHGDPVGQNRLGTFYETGRGGLPKDDGEAARLFKLSADKGLAPSQYHLGEFYEAGRGGLPKDDQEAARLYKLAADAGSANAQARLGGFYAAGRGGLREDEREAARLCKLAADADSSSAGKVAAGGDPLPDWIDALRTRIVKCWYPPVDVDAKAKFYVELRISLNPDGSLSQEPSVVNAAPSPPVPSSAAFNDSAVQAVERAQPFTMLKAEDYDHWKVTYLGFSPEPPPAGWDPTR